jgi:hypothetical protein
LIIKPEGNLVEDGETLAGERKIPSRRIREARPAKHRRMLTSKVQNNHFEGFLLKGKTIFGGGMGVFLKSFIYFE